MVISQLRQQKTRESASTTIQHMCTRSRGRKKTITVCRFILQYSCLILINVTNCQHKTQIIMRSPQGCLFHSKTLNLFCIQLDTTVLCIILYSATALLIKPNDIVFCALILFTVHSFTVCCNALL